MLKVPLAKANAARRRGARRALNNPTIAIFLLKRDGGSLVKGKDCRCSKIEGGGSEEGSDQTKSLSCEQIYYIDRAPLPSPGFRLESSLGWLLLSRL